MYQQSEKNLLNSNISSTCPLNMVNFSPLVAEISSVVWSTPANFSGFRVLASLLQRRRSPEANQNLRDVWPSSGLVHDNIKIYHDIYIFGGYCPLTELCPVLFTGPSRHPANSVKALTEIPMTDLASCFFIHHWTPDGRVLLPLCMLSDNSTVPVWHSN